MTDNYPAVKVLIKILTLSPILASPSSRFFLPRVCFCFCFHPHLIPSFTFLTPLCSSVCFLFFLHIFPFCSHFSFSLSSCFLFLLYAFCVPFLPPPFCLSFHISLCSSLTCLFLSVLSRLQEDPPTGVSGAPSENNIMLWNAVIFG